MKQSKRWLLSMMKTSGSYRKHTMSGDFSDERNTKRFKQDDEDLPTHESYRKTHNFYNGKIKTDLLKRFLYGQVGKDWNEVYSEIISRIPTKLLDYKDCVYWYVAHKVEMRDGLPYDKEEHQFIWTPEQGEFFKSSVQMTFYVHPETNILTKIKP